MLIVACLPKADIFLLMAQCEIENLLFDRAVTSCMKSFFLYQSMNLPEKICEAKLLLALTYMQ